MRREKSIRAHSFQSHPSTAPKRVGYYGLTKFATDHLNFYRVHLGLFIIVPFIASGIFYASDTTYKLSYVDSLYMVVSAATVTGLVTVESSTMSTFQQVLLFFLMCVGSTSFVSIVTVIIRRAFFKRKFDYLIVHNAELRRRVQEVRSEEATLHPLRNAINGITHPHLSPVVLGSQISTESNNEKRKKSKKPEKITSDMVRRLDTPVRVNQMNVDGYVRDDIGKENSNKEGIKEIKDSTSGSKGGIIDRESSLSSPVALPDREHIEFEEELPTASSDLRFRRNNTSHRIRRSSHSHTTRDYQNSKALRRTGTYPPSNSLHSGFGGINPISLAADFIKRLPVVAKFERSMTMPRTTTLQSIHTVRDLSGNGTGIKMEKTKTVSYLTFDATISGNSVFRGLTRAQEEELGGVEYRALTLLLKIVVGYWFFSQMIAVLIIAPYLTYSETYRSLFTKPPNRVDLNPTWFVFFQVWSAWSNNGMSLIDTSMVPFYESYLFIVVLSLLILMGNTAYPVFLRLTIWTLSKLVPNRSRTKETLQFLLDHPRRCFLYLFPSHQTWFLVFVLCVLNGIDWVSFIVLDVGNKEIGQLSPGTRAINGLFQAFAVRSAGFSITNLAEIAPALQFLYSVMMYVAVYPIALSVRSTNVYQEKSMGVFPEEGENDDDAEDKFKKDKSSSSYIAYHARRQLAFDMWWLVCAVWLICIVERDAIQSNVKPWITVFTIIFEISSAYGTVGLSLGTPIKNTSLSGDLRTLSKLILVAVMIRGRHRGLPKAIDRAILLPSDLERFGEESLDLPETDSPEDISDELNPIEEVEVRDDGIVNQENMNGDVNENSEKEEEQEQERKEGKEDQVSDKDKVGWTLDKT